MSKNAYRFAGGLRNVKGSNCAPYLGLFAQVQEHKATVQAQTELMIPAEPVVAPNAGIYNDDTGDYVFHYRDVDAVSVVRITNGHRMSRIKVNKH